MMRVCVVLTYTRYDVPWFIEWTDFMTRQVVLVLRYIHVRCYNLFGGIPHPQILDCVEKKKTKLSVGKVIKRGKTGKKVKNSVFRNVILYGLAEVY
jgi:hypothetical protein